ncbi:MAG: hypothetical protein IKG18_16080 [Atopobiaceae bacterium]|nr:hypothetical protein [Atopobiaceae bacterium]
MHAANAARDAAGQFVDQAMQAAEGLVNDPKFQKKVQVTALDIVAEVVDNKAPGAGKFVKHLVPFFK